ncbi:MAG: ABC transporter permease [Acidobacteriota bacterium]
MTPETAAAPVMTVIEPPGRVSGAAWREVWAFRELLYFLVWRDLKVRYKQTVLGAAWAVIQPLATMVIFSLFFGRLAGMPSDGIPYPIFSYAGLVPWTYFATGIAGGAASLVGSQSLISKVYFPRLLVPLASVVTPIVDAGIALAVLLALMAWYGVVPGPALVLLPGFALLGLVAAAAVSLWLAALNVEYRDVRYVMPFLVQVWLFLTPVAYPTSLVPAAWRWVYGLNPMVTVVEGFRWTLVGTPAPAPAMVAASLVMVAALFWTGLGHFRRTERVFADVI